VAIGASAVARPAGDIRISGVDGLRDQADATTTDPRRIGRGCAALDHDHVESMTGEEHRRRCACGAPIHDGDIASSDATTGRGDRDHSTSTSIDTSTPFVMTSRTAERDGLLDHGAQALGIVAAPLEPVADTSATETEDAEQVDVALERERDRRQVDTAGGGDVCDAGPPGMP
jgi:hypothetical protein